VYVCVHAHMRPVPGRRALCPEPEPARGAPSAAVPGVRVGPAAAATAASELGASAPAWAERHGRSGFGEHVPRIHYRGSATADQQL
jgi:hypothetical protein